MLRVATVTLLPVIVTEHEHGFTTRLFVFWNKCSSENGFHAEHVEEVCRNNTCLHAFWLVATVEYETHGVVLDHLHRFILVAIILEFRNRKTETVDVVESSLLIQHDETVTFFVGKRAQQHAVNDAKESSVSAYAESQSYYCRQSKPWIPAQNSHSKLDVLPE